MIRLACMVHWHQKFKLRLPAMMLLVVTVVFWSMYERYEGVGPVLLKSPALEQAHRTVGNVSEHNGVFILDANDASAASVRIDFTLPPEVLKYERVRVRGRIKLEGVVVGKHSWNCARLLITQYDAEQEWMPGHHFLIAEKGTRGWTSYHDVFVIEPDAARVAVILQQGGKAGVARFTDIEVEPVDLRASFIWWTMLFRVLWIAMAGLYFTRCRLHSRRLKRLITLNVLVILVGTLLPEAWIASGADKADLAMRELRPQHAELVKPAAGEPPTPPKTGITKSWMDWIKETDVEPHAAGHFILFASLCFLVYVSAALERQHPVYFVKVGFDVLFFAAITESLQLLTLDRSAGMTDLLIDLYGMGLAFVIFLLCLPFVRRFRPRAA